MTFLQSIKNITSSTESKLKNATNTEPLGPYNHELIELSSLTYSKKHLSIITSILTRKLTNIHHSFLNSPSSMNRSLTYKSSRNDHIQLPKRSNTLNYQNNSSTDSNINKNCLVLLKILTVILYLLQNGSQQFLDWVQTEYMQLIKPLTKIMFPNKYHESLKFKLLKISNLIDNQQYLKQYRSSLHKLKTDLLIPGMKRNSLDNIDLLNVNEDQTMNNYIYENSPKSRKLNPDSNKSSQISNQPNSNSPPTLTKQHTLSPLFN